ncbi:MAG: hypothetical protein ACRDS1_16500 [Pseudonocardiaceae bacterium]
MPYLISVLLAAAGAVVLGTLLLRLIGPVRRLAGTARGSRAGLTERSGQLADRISALRVKLVQRRRRRNTKAPSGPAAA